MPESSQIYALPARGRFATPARIAVVACLYFAAARLGLLLELPGTNTSPVWPPSGIGLAAVLLFGLRVWPGILAGAFVANLTTLPLNAAGFAASTGIGIGNTLEHLVAWVLIRRLVGTREPFERAPDVFLTVLAAAVACAVAGTIGATSLWQTGIIPGDLYRAVWFTWWLGDLAGMVVIAPALFYWVRRPRPGLPTARLLELAALALTTAAVAELLFGAWIDSEIVGSLPYLVVPALLWAAFRFGPRETATLSVVISVIAVWHTWHLMAGTRAALAGRDIFAPFVGPSISANQSLLMLQIFVCAVAVTALILAAAVMQRRAAEEAQRKLNRELEDRVRRRTVDLAHANEQLEQSNLELQQYAYVASHDLQSPLRSVAGLADFLQEDYGEQLDAKATDIVDRIIEGCRRMQEMISDLLEISRVESRALPFQATALDDVLDEVVEQLHASIGEAGAVVTREKLPAVTGDPSQLTHVFANLVGNALKYRGEAPPHIHVSARRDRDQWVLGVKDNGIGIAPEHHDKVFDIFRRLHTQRAYPGTGIGLAICRRIVNRHGGRIWVESGIDEGSTFLVSLPDGSPD